jgi:RNA polymerase sigma factor (sigma-70 family)
VSSSADTRRWKSERELVIAAASGEPDAVDQLVETFLPHISRVARIYRHNRAVGRNELIQDGIVGLLRALERYDPARGPFWPYAAWWVRQAMQQLVAEMSRHVVLSDRALRRLSRIKDARALWLRTEAREPTVRELTEVCGCAREDVEWLLAAELPARALEETPGGGDGFGAPLAERIADETSGDGYDAVVNWTGPAGLHAGCEQLPERERHVLYAHFGLAGPARTLRDIAAELSLSVERVRQIEQAALTKLRNGVGVAAPALRRVDPGNSPRALRAVLTHELGARGPGDGRVRNLVMAAHEVAAGVWLRGRSPQRVRVGSANGASVCEVSDPAAGPTSRAAAAIVTRLTSRIDRARAERTFLLWA